MAHISETNGARQILCAYLFLPSQNTPPTKFLYNLKRKSFLGTKNAKGIALGFFKNFDQKFHLFKLNKILVKGVLRHARTRKAG